MASVTTRDHNQIQEWARSHGACPAVVSRTGGMLRFEFDPERAQALREVDWDDFFRVFDDKGLELVYDDKPGSRFHKFAYPETITAKTPKPRRARALATTPRTTAAQRALRETIAPSAGRKATSRGPKAVGATSGRGNAVSSRAASSRSKSTPTKSSRTKATRAKPTTSRPRKAA